MNSSNKWNEYYEKNTTLVPYTEVFTTLLSMKKPEELLNKKFLEIGCGTGNNLFFAKKILKMDVFGVDYSKNAIDLCQSRLINDNIDANLSVKDAKELDFFGTPQGLLRIFGNTSIPGIDATSGSLGHGLGIGIGYAIAAKHNGMDSRVFVVISEGEMYEGSIWESALVAAQQELDNLVVILDRNRKIILGDTEDLVRLNPIADKWEAFGFHTVEVDGHSFPELLDAFSNIGKTSTRPLVVIANTVKGKGIPLMEHKEDWHYWQGMDESTRIEIRRELLNREHSYQ